MYLKKCNLLAQVYFLSDSLLDLYISLGRLWPPSQTLVPGVTTKTICGRNVYVWVDFQLVDFNCQLPQGRLLSPTLDRMTSICLLCLMLSISRGNVCQKMHCNTKNKWVTSFPWLNLILNNFCFSFSSLKMCICWQNKKKALILVWEGSLLISIYNFWLFAFHYTAKHHKF